MFILAGFSINTSTVSKIMHPLSLCFIVTKYFIFAVGVHTGLFVFGLSRNTSGIHENSNFGLFSSIPIFEP